MSQNLSSAAVMIGAFKVNVEYPGVDVCGNCKYCKIVYKLSLPSRTCALMLLIAG